MGDARFNNVILEHLFRWVAGKDASLWSPPYFYPYPGTLTFSDNHFGTGLVYVCMRLLGLGPEGAFIGWYTLAAPLNFISCYYVLRRMGLSPKGSAVGAFIFTFAFNVSARHGHAQLSYRYAVPLAMLALQRLVETHAPRQLALVALWVTLQFYASIYLGYFLVLLLVAYAVMQTIMPATPEASRPHQAVLGSLTRTWRDRSMGCIATIALCGGALVLLFYPYMHYSKLYQLTRDFTEIHSMLPRPGSYLLADGSMIWGKLSARITGLPMRWEHQMFFGASACALALLGIVGWRDRQAKIAAGAILFLVVLTLDVHGHSIYFLFYKLPLVNAIRGVSRIGLVMVFPVAFLAGRGLDYLLAPARHRLLKHAVAFLLVLFMLVEYVAFYTQSVPLKDLEQRLAGLVALVPDPLPPDAILYVPPSNSGAPFNNELDGMRLVAATDRVTLNGYSGNVPKGFSDPAVAACDVVNNRLANYAAFTGGGYDQYAALVNRVVVLGRAGHCTPLPALAVRTHFSGNVPEVTVKATRLEVVNPRLVDGKLVVTLQIENQSTDTLHSISDDNHPIRFSWRLVPTQTSAGPYDGWNTRKDLASDVRAGEAQETDIIVDPPHVPGTYRIESSLVQENALWFHQFGMSIAQSDKLIEVKQDGSITVLP